MPELHLVGLLYIMFLNHRCDISLVITVILNGGWVWF